MLIETITAKLQADVGQFQQGFTQAQQTTQRFEQTAARSTASARTLQNAMRALAFQSVGVPGPLGRVATVLASFGIGSGLVTGVLVGIAAIGTAMNLLSKRAALLADNVVAARERLRRMFGEVAEGTDTEEGLALLQKRLAEAQAELTRMRSLFQRGQTAEDVLREGPRRVTQTELAAQLNVVRDLQAAIVRAEQNLVPLRAKEADEVERMLRAVRDFAQELPLLQLDIDSTVTDFLAAWAEMQRTIADELAAKGNKLFKPEDLGLKDLSNNLNKQFAQMGLDAMQSLARSLLSGARDIKKLLFGLLLDFSLGGIFAGIGKALGLSGVSNLVAPTMDLEAPTLDLAAAPTADLHATPMALQFAPATNWPPPRTPFDMARDAEIQRWLREAVLVARSDGFR